MTLSASLANRLGFLALGLTNNFAYVIMLSAAYDLLNQLNPHVESTTLNTAIPDSSNFNIDSAINSTLTATANNITQQKYCNAHSTSTILLADTLPSLTTKLLYPCLLVSVPTSHKAIITALLSAAAFLLTGLSATQALIFSGVVCASFSSGLGESTYLSNTPLYGDVSLSGWSMGTGAAGLLGAAAYALLRIVLPIKIIMMIMLVVPITMLVAFFYVIKPIGEQEGALKFANKRINSNGEPPVAATANLSVITPARIADVDEQQQPIQDLSLVRDYGARDGSNSGTRENSLEGNLIDNAPFDFQAKVRCLPSLAKYFLPLLLVYFAEYFINQGLFELVYYPEISYLDHAGQYRWFQVSYQLGVMISRSSLDIIRIKNLWTMSLLQALNAAIFLAHTSKLVHIPSFYLVVGIIVYEGLLGGFTYVNAFYRVKKEVISSRQEFSISTVTTADSLGIVIAGLVALPVHNALCKLYD